MTPIQILVWIFLTELVAGGIKSKGPPPSAAPVGTWQVVGLSGPSGREAHQTPHTAQLGLLQNVRMRPRHLIARVNEAVQTHLTQFTGASWGKIYMMARHLSLQTSH